MGFMQNPKIICKNLLTNRVNDDIVELTNLVNSWVSGGERYGQRHGRTQNNGDGTGEA